ncbi:MAG: cryptochrome/photolyase family protein [Methylococcus sp.]|nr:MAG: cryptochrome/photolyase family protein [Methylococcus sp.]
MLPSHRRLTTLRLILGDQLNPLHSGFRDIRPEVCHVLMEIRQETDYVLHHAQKILAIFAAMRHFAATLEQAGHRVRYLHIDDSANTQSLTANLDALIAEMGAVAFEYQEPDEWRLDRQLHDYAASLPIPSRRLDSEHFLSTRDEAARLFAGRRQWLMEHFYRHMRQRHGVLMEPDGKPVGGRWNFDADNRKYWPGQPAEPADARPVHDHGALWLSIVGAGVSSFGDPQASQVRWPLNRDEALAQLDAFIDTGLPHFGDYQDAMSTKGWRLFHSLLSFALNVKMLHPREVVARAEQAYQEGRAPLAAAEGFIRQILGWREYVRGVYWARMPGYAESNVFAHCRPLPVWFWTGQTRMRCLAHAIGQSLEMAHAHHIQRLMIIGNFALLAGLDPAAVHRWYLGVYIDAFEWVELPNTLGMSQYADGGLLATKPYVSSAAYIHRMSDYCQGCHYDRKARLGERACPFNALYWDFFARHGERLAGNPRLGMVYRQLDKMSRDDKAAITAQAEAVLSRVDTV